MVSPVLIVDGHKGLGTKFWIELFLTDNEKKTLDLKLIEEYLLHIIDDFQKKYSRFDESSILSTLNSGATIPYDHDLEAMFRKASHVSKETNGIFSLFIKEELEKKGYGQEKVTTQSNNKEEVTDLLITDATMTISGDKGIDLGGIGKGYLIDKLADILLNKFALPYFLINGGGDMYMTSNQGEEIEVFLEHPTDVGSYLNTIKIKNGAFCSSSSFKRSWIHNGKPVNHFIAEKEVWAASFVLGPTTTMADMYATVFCILSDNKDLLKELSKKETLDYLVIDSNGVTAKSSSFPSFIQP